MLKPLIALAAALALGACAMQPASAQDQAVQTATDAAGWNTAALANVVSYAQSQKTTGFLIIQNDKTIAEHSWPLTDADATFKANLVHGTSSPANCEKTSPRNKRALSPSWSASASTRA